MISLKSPWNSCDDCSGACSIAKREWLIGNCSISPLSSVYLHEGHIPHPFNSIAMHL